MKHCSDRLYKVNKELNCKKWRRFHYHYIFKITAEILFCLIYNLKKNFILTCIHIIQFHIFLLVHLVLVGIFKLVPAILCVE